MKSTWKRKDWNIRNEYEIRKKTTERNNILTNYLNDSHFVNICNLLKYVNMPSF